MLRLKVFAPLVALTALGACSTAGDLGAKSLCGARENACVNQCRDAYSSTRDADGLRRCEQSCRAQEAPACRPGDQ